MGFTGAVIEIDIAVVTTQLSLPSGHDSAVSQAEQNNLTQNLFQCGLGQYLGSSDPK